MLLLLLLLLQLLLMLLLLLAADLLISLAAVRSCAWLLDTSLISAVASLSSWPVVIPESVRGSARPCKLCRRSTGAQCL